MCNSLKHVFISSDVLDIEFLAVAVDIGSAKLYITCSYIPPSSDFCTYEKHLDAIGHVCSLLRDNDYILVLGDFNLPMISWIRLPDTGFYTALSPCDWISDVVNHVTSFNLFQINGITNSNNRILDLALVNDSSSFVVFAALFPYQ